MSDVGSRWHQVGADIGCWLATNRALFLERRFPIFLSEALSVVFAKDELGIASIAGWLDRFHYLRLEGSLYFFLCHES